ncbi:TPA: haloacid dehalogenase-like hydrolase [Pseudomonas aeruginosa]|uniref:HAD family hydrolase n=1 Tax=Pseudomonas aeruginosa TaxID=287 RepID=UPI000F768B1D|nr:HAD family hydrolase [Pseudomonas aeruginosa]MBR7823018.1 haloacid dehalogenase-like hydrolase [Pseudomonas aeruginosa]MBR7851228.1 haloacid dehalogenase-like hydrolase [Pseudomonas aeruginosa]MBR7863890.1 haloacid dehalogenase-like hydrolase [Pseudomonas aeruginosa]MBR7870691.1 haloacid dehalogenase-like hydrolase [Pseudomonas aeruginosa]MBW6202537.1 haloacid dehalogenase-like hydrolase [Pseudomonas aeruginosa]
MARKHIPFVIAYDFDGTLSPGNMQEYDFVPALGIKPLDFWKEAKAMAREQQADEILAYMRLMIERARAAQVRVTKKDFADFGASIQLFPGVKDWFTRINDYGRSKQVKVDHFIISSGLREMIEGTPINKHFSRVYASGFMYDHHGVPCWPSLAVNYTTKTQYLFRINKGSLDVHDNSVINKYVEHSERPVPFSNMVFIGDGETDIPSMRLVKDQGGHSIAVYGKGKRGARDKALRLVEEGRTNLAAAADYSEQSAVDRAVKAMIDKVASNRMISEANG